MTQASNGIRVAATMQLPLLLLLLLFATSATGQSTPPPITEYVNDTLLRVTFPDDTSVNIRCYAMNGFIGISNQYNSEYVTKSMNYGIDLSYEKGNYDSINAVRKKMGPYHCLYKVGDAVNSYAFIVSEKPKPEFIVNENIKAVSTTGTFEPTCAVTKNIPIWERYVDSDGTFVQIASSGRSLSLTFTELQRDQSAGFTIYRCYDRSEPEKIEYFEATKDSALEVRSFKSSNYTSQLLLEKVIPAGPLTLECHGTRAPTTETMKFFFRRTNDPDYKQIDCADSKTGYECIPSQAQWQLKIKPFSPSHAGDYYCVKNNVTQRAKLRVDFGDVLIQRYSKSDYIMGTANTIQCKPVHAAFASNMFYLLKRPGQPQLVINPNETKEGYRVFLDSDSHLVMKFGYQPDAVNSTLECHLHYATDFVNIKTGMPALTLEKSVRTGYVQLPCSDDNRGVGGTKVVYELLPDGSKGNILRRFPGQKIYYMQTAGFTGFKQFRCFMMVSGVEIKSNIVSFGIPNVKLDIVVAGDRNPAKKVFVEGKDVDIDCQFSDMPFLMEPVKEKLRLLKNASSATADQLVTNATIYRYLLRRVSAQDSGIYQCKYGVGAVLLRSAPLEANVSSSESMISICDSSKFVCDSMCKDRSLLCDKKEDCADKSDERPEVCSKCEPNSVLCENKNGTEPKVRCVLKHWLCDGQDDCGNGFDEDLSLHRKWCFKENACKSCKPEETCCPGSDKCILRSYECDKEVDCPGSENEEQRCGKGDCLKITKPTKRETITVKVGDPIQMKCAATGTERPTLNWRRNWAAVPQQFKEVNAVEMRLPDTREYLVTNDLTVAAATKEMAGIYNCEAVNNCDRLMSYEIELKVNE